MDRSAKYPVYKINESKTSDWLNLYDLPIVRSDFGNIS